MATTAWNTLVGALKLSLGRSQAKIEALRPLPASILPRDQRHRWICGLAPLSLALSSSLSWAQSSASEPTSKREFFVGEPWPHSPLGATEMGVAGTEPQQVELPRFDITLSFQRLTQNPTHDPLVSSEQTYSVGGLALTWAFHWSKRLRTEVEAAATSQASADVYYWTPSAGVYPAVVSHRYRHGRFSVAQLVTFRRKAWVSPQFGVGLVLGREDRESYPGTPNLDPFWRNYWQSRTQIPIQALQEKALADHPSRTETKVRPFVVAAVKVYFTRRAFARLGATIIPTNTSRQSTLLLGIGHDW